MQEISVSEIYLCLWCKMEHVEEDESICDDMLRVPTGLDGIYFC